MRWPAIVIGLLLVTSGCFGPSQSWTLTTRGQLEEAGDRVVFNGTISIDGMGGNVTVTGVEVYFLDEDMEVMERVSVGRVGESTTGYRSPVRFRTSLDHPPAYVLPTVEQVDDPDGAKKGFSGLERADGGYKPTYDYDAFERPPEHESD